MNRIVVAALTALTIAGEPSLATTARPPLLVGFAALPADTFNPGPTSGRFLGEGSAGFEHRQPVQGFSSIIAHGESGFLALSDNGFGARRNSADALLTVHQIQLDFRTKAGGGGGVTLGSSAALSDPRRVAPFEIVAEMAAYPNGARDVPVHTAIREGRLLTGADFDPESLRRDASGDYWIGDEFGPFLLRLDADFALRSVVETPGVVSPDNPLRSADGADHPRSGGYEGMAISADGLTLYPMLERPVAGDPDGALRIAEFDVASERFTGRRWFYPIDPRAAAIGEVTRIEDDVFVVIERDHHRGPDAHFKRLFLIRLGAAGEGGTLRKIELADLLAIDDRHDLNRDGSTIFAFPFVTIESVLPLDERTLLVVNDNNYPAGGGRAPDRSDETEFIKLRFDRPIIERAP